MLDSIRNSINTCWNYTPVKVTVSVLAIVALAIGILGLATWTSSAAFAGALGLTISGAVVSLLAFKQTRMSACLMHVIFRCNRAKNRQLGNTNIYMGNDIKGMDLVVVLKTQSMSCRGIDSRVVDSERALKRKLGEADHFYNIFAYYVTGGRESESNPALPVDPSRPFNQVTELQEFVNRRLQNKEKVLFYVDPTLVNTHFQAELPFLAYRFNTLVKEGLSKGIAYNVSIKEAERLRNANFSTSKFWLSSFVEPSFKGIRPKENLPFKLSQFFQPDGHARY